MVDNTLGSRMTLKPVHRLLAHTRLVIAYVTFSGLRLHWSETEHKTYAHCSAMSLSLAKLKPYNDSVSVRDQKAAP
jgi:hypothetical protein